MLNHLKLRTLYAIHMLVPLTVAAWLIDRLHTDTLSGLASLLR